MTPTHIKRNFSGGRTSGHHPLRIPCHHGIRKLAPKPELVRVMAAHKDECASQCKALPPSAPQAVSRVGELGVCQDNVNKSLIKHPGTGDLIFS